MNDSPGVEAKRQQFGLLVPDRILLERIILPTLGEMRPEKRVLLVGCAECCAWYPEYFAAHRVWTMDPDLAVTRFGAPQHIADRLENARTHFAGDYFDVIVKNGILGFGLNDPASADAAFAACYDVLAPGGLLVLGWNEIRCWADIQPDALPAVARFKPVSFPAIGTQCVRLTYASEDEQASFISRGKRLWSHTFAFYTKVVS
jgi:hypothetical protein